MMRSCGSLTSQFFLHSMYNYCIKVDDTTYRKAKVIKDSRNGCLKEWFIQEQKWVWMSANTHKEGLGLGGFLSEQ